MPIQLSAGRRHIVFHALLLSILETIFFLVGRAVEKEYGVAFGALLIFGFNFVFLLAARSTE